MQVHTELIAIFYTVSQKTGHAYYGQ